MDEGNGRYPPIAGYAAIGDCRSAALVSDRGSIDWLCLPRFDSPSIFAAILDPDRGGRFSIQPTGRFRSGRRYLGPTNILETWFETDSGRARLVDVMPVADPEDPPDSPRPERSLIRALYGDGGEVEIEIHYDPRPDYGRIVPRLSARRAFGTTCDFGPHRLDLMSEVPLEPAGERPGTHGRVRLRAGERRILSLASSRDDPSVAPPLGDLAEQWIARSRRWWERWSARCRYTGPYRDSVVRSALALKLLTYAPSGAIVAAPTTSLPEWIAGERNWDYRFCWLRDSSMTVESLLSLGYREESEAFLEWMLYATELTWPELQVLYDVFGEVEVGERTIDRLAGYAGSRPVRVGNDAIHQHQLDVYRTVVEAALHHVVRGAEIDRPKAARLVRLGETVCRRWREPDHGIWETRGEPAHYTSSKAAAWVALDRLLDLNRRGAMKVPVERFTAERDAIRSAVETMGYDDRLSSYVSRFGGQEVDASLLLLGLWPYADPRSARMRSTVARVRQELGEDALIRRYAPGFDGLAGPEGAFGICSFWAVACLALEGEVDRATADFDRLLGYANDVGLFAEEIDPASGAALGNFPQAYTHVGLIHAALTLAAAS